MCANVSRWVPTWLCMMVKLAAPWLRFGSNCPGCVTRSYPSFSMMTCTPNRLGVMNRGRSPCISSPRGYTFPCFTSPAAFTIISGVMKFSIPRLSCSPHRPQLPRGPHLPGTVHGAGVFASCSSSGCAGACARAPGGVTSDTETARPTIATRNIFTECMARTLLNAECETTIPPATARRATLYDEWRAARGTCASRGTPFDEQHSNRPEWCSPS